MGPKPAAGTRSGSNEGEDRTKGGKDRHRKPWWSDRWEKYAAQHIQKVLAVSVLIRKSCEAQKIQNFLTCIVIGTAPRRNSKVRAGEGAAALRQESSPRKEGRRGPDGQTKASSASTYGCLLLIAEEREETGEAPNDLQSGRLSRATLTLRSSKPHEERPCPMNLRRDHRLRFERANFQCLNTILYTNNIKYNIIYIENNL